MPAIDLQHVEKKFRDKWMRKRVAISDVTLAVEEGEAFGFIGPNGAGKSTTIKILTGVIRADSGTASMFGIDCRDFRARLGMAYVPENPYLPDYLTPMEVMRMGVSMHGLRLDNVDAHCMEWLERFDIARVAKKKIRSFSKGMTQRTALAHALVVKPKLLILDEPLSGLDPIGRRDVVDILMAYRQSGGTIFFSSHVLHDVERLADRFGLIHQGLLRTVRSPAELVSNASTYHIRSRGTEPVDGMVKDIGDRWYLETTHDHLWEHLRQIDAAGHRLIEVKPGLSLEAAFFSAIGQPLNLAQDASVRHVD